MPADDTTITPQRAAGAPAAAATSGQSSLRARKAMLGAWFGFFVDLFDIYLPTVALAPAIGYFLAPDLGSTGVAIAGGMIFTTTLLGRPIGAAVFGRIADTVGRKRATVVAVSGAGVATMLMALLPGYAQFGVLSVILFIALRLVGGIFLGGQYTGANPLAMEAAPRHKRGLYSGIINTGFPLAYATVSLITLVLLLFMPAQGAGSAYAQWGWRIPFVIGSLLAFTMVLFYRRSVDESRVFTTGEQARGSSPIKALLSRDNARAFLQVFALMTGFWLSLQPIAAVLPSLLSGDEVGLSSQSSTLLLVVAYVLLAGVDVAAAVFSQRIGRRRFLIGSAVAMAVLAAPLYFVLLRYGPGSTPLVVLTTVALVILVVSPWGVLPAYINERFPTSVRASGYGLAYSLAVVAPSFYTFYQAGLSTLMPMRYTGIALLAIGALFVLGAALAGPETKDIEFTDQEETR